MRQIVLNKLLFSIVFTFLFTSFCSGQTYSSLVSDSTIVPFIRWRLTVDTFHNFYSSRQSFAFSSSILPWKRTNFEWDSSVSRAQNKSDCIYNERLKWLDTLFTDNDKSFIVKQSQSYKTYEWLVKPKPNKMAKKDYQFYFSLPLFFLDRQYAILQELYYCGEDCGEKSIILYKKTKSGWTVYQYLQRYIF